MNAQFARNMGQPLGASIMNFTVGLVSMLAYLALVRPSIQFSGAAAAPWWSWFSGMIGVLFVASSAVNAVRLGAAVFVAVTIAGQMLGSFLIDWFGLFGFPQAHISAGRVAGLLLLGLSVYLIQRG